MKVNLAIFKYFPHGGLQSDFRRIAAECVRRGHEVVIYAGLWEGPPIPGTVLRTVPVNGWSNHARAKSFERALPAAMRPDRTDARTGHDGVLVGFNRMAGLDVYFAADNCFAAEASAAGGWRRWFTSRYRVYEAMERSVFADPSHAVIMYLTERQKREFQKRYGTAEARFRLLPPGIAPDRIRPASETEAAAIRAETRMEFRLRPDDRLLLQICSGFATKGVDLTLRAFAELPGALRRRSLLLIAGREKSPRFRRLARRLGVSDRVVFAGPRDDVARLLLAADVMVHPARKEATGTVLAEAAASGLPVVCSGNCGYAYLVRQAGGFVLDEPFNLGQMVRELRRMLGSLKTLRGRQRDARRRSRGIRLGDRASAAADVIEECARR